MLLLLLLLLLHSETERNILGAIINRPTRMKIACKNFGFSSGCMRPLYFLFYDYTCTLYWLFVRCLPGSVLENMVPFSPSCHRLGLGHAVNPFPKFSIRRWV